MKYPNHIKSRLQKAEFKKNVLEKQLNYLVQVGARKDVIDAAHEKFFKQYMIFANIATRACEQGLL